MYALPTQPKTFAQMQAAHQATMQRANELGLLEKDFSRNQELHRQRAQAAYIAGISRIAQPGSMWAGRWADHINNDFL